MAKKIGRRDFLNGVAVSGSGLILQGFGADAEALATAPQGATPAPKVPYPSNYYPPTLTGMRGSHKGSFEVAHALAWRGEKPARYQPLDEHYDLVVVGAGMSGLAAAWYYRKKMGPEVRILLLDNHDDFGGHAKRNEFHHNGRMMLSLGGAQNLEAPSDYSDTAAQLMNDLGIDEDFIAAMDQRTPDDLVLAGKFNAANGIAIPGTEGHVVIGGNWFAAVFGGDGYTSTVRELPIAPSEQDKLIAFFGGSQDFLTGLSLSEKWRYINTVSYNQFLIEKVGLEESTLPILNAVIIHMSGVSGWHLTVAEAISNVASGINSMGWVGKTLASLGGSILDSVLQVRMFPDGNASIARLLTQKLIPEVAPTMQGPEDVAIAHFDYSKLDINGRSTRMRLNSTVVGVREVESKRVEVDYVTGGSAQRVTADSCVLACYNNLIPHLCPELPERQKEGLSYGVKTPFVYASVLLENGHAFTKLGATFFQCPYDTFQWVSCAPTMAVGGYEPPRGPDDPMVLFLMHSPMTGPKGELTGREQLRLGRHKIYATPFASYEAQIRSQLQALMGTQGFDHEKDILAITVNRIPHGYAYPYLALDDPEWKKGQAPHEIGRAQFGRISIANSDSQAIALMDAAFDAAWRAVQEQT